MLNGFELHVYNRCNLYSELERIFGLEPSIFMDSTDESGATAKEQAMNLANERASATERKVRAEAVMARTWRDLIPVIKLDICSGRVVFGNRLVPTSLSISVEEAHLVYSTKPPASKLDYLMHFVKAKAENCRVMLVPSPNYIGMVDDPPRYMGEGFVVMSSNYIELYFYMDEPGLVPDEPVLLQLANGDVVESAPPIWGVDIKCGKGTDFSYGPWADRQREHLFKFFYPPDYQNLIVTPQPKPGDRRQMQAFDIRLSTLNEATIDILFSKNKETNAVHVNIGAGSYLEVNLPWIVLQDGYTTKITGQLLHLEATTSLQYRSMAESETLEFAVRCHYPLVWNQHQNWSISFTGCKATANLVYCHKGFFQDLINDWASKVRPDILHFVPYTWKISLLLKDFELITLSNQYNWIDCSSTNQENSHVAFCGDLFDLSFDLSFEDFLPIIVPLKIWIQGEGVDMCLYLPEVNTSRVILLAIEKNMNLNSRKTNPTAVKWRKKCLSSLGWINCWSVPIVAISIKYEYHPIAPLGPDPQADITTPEKEEILLSPMRISRSRKQPQVQWNHNGKNKFDPSTMTPDKVSVELEIGPSIILLYGSIIRNFINLKENIFGEDQTFTDMQKSTGSENNSLSELGIKLNPSVITPVSGDSSDNTKVVFDPRLYRPLQVTVSVTLHDIQGYLVKNCAESEQTYPIILIERFGFEMKKGYKETKLQVLVSPSFLIIADSATIGQQSPQSHLNRGHLMLSSLQLRGHAMFSDENRTLDEETIEYAWMIEVQLGQLTGRLTVSQLFNLLSALETFVLLASDSENNLSPPKVMKICHHGYNTSLCTHTNIQTKYHCPTSEDIKYRMSRVAIDLIDIYIVENGTAMQAWLSPLRLCVCNLHSDRFDLGVTGLLPHLKLIQYTHANMQTNPINKTGTNSSQKIKYSDTDSWVEVGSVAVGPILLEAATSLSPSEKGVQNKFLKCFDEKSKRLWFLWPKEEGTSKNNQCGCLGGCAFFGSNRNGTNFLKPSRNDILDNVNVAIFNIQDVKSGEYGYGQSLLHDGHLVFHTPPYSGLDVCLQGSPPISVSSPSPQPASLHPPSLSAQNSNNLTRRFSYTSVYKGSNSVSNNTKAEVPYARLVDSEGLCNQKLDSDSKLNKSILSVPQMESSMSDSKLALNSFNKHDLVGQHYSAAKLTNPISAKESIGYHKKMVNISESHYSLNSHLTDDQDSREVQRTVSMNSGNQSEVFFSAEDEISTSRSSSLRMSRSNKRSSSSHYKTASSGEYNSNKKCSTPSLADPYTLPRTIGSLPLDVTIPNDSDDSHSFSSTSFISALSSQEDMTLINLHAQANKPICDSPILMASYICHLSHSKCKNWTQCSLPTGTDAFSVPLFKNAENGKLMYCGNKYIPLFEKKVGEHKGIRLTPRHESHVNNQQGGDNIFNKANINSHFNVQGRIHPYSQTWWEILKGPNDDNENNTEGIVDDFLKGIGKNQTALMLKFRGAIDVMVSPLLLESTQRFIETLTPVVANIHPVSILNHLHFSCARSVEAANILKQEHNLVNWVQHTNQKKEKSLENAKLEKNKDSQMWQPNIYEENISTQMNINVILPKVNIVLLQSSIIEDLITFSALENIQDLTCASIFAVCLENINFKYVSNKEMLEAVQIYYRPSLRVLSHKKTFGIMKAPKAFISAHSDNTPNRQDKREAVFLETSQKHCEDINVTLDIGNTVMHHYNRNRFYFLLLSTYIIQ